MLGATSLIPIHDDNPTRRLSVITIAIIAVNVVFFFMEPQLGQSQTCELGQFFFKWGVVPQEVSSGEQLTGPICEGVPLLQKSIYLSLITSMFLHGGILHIAGNMLFLWVFGNNIEDVLGKIRFIIFYLLTGLLASLAHVFANVDSVVPTIGASGAVAGLLGAYLVLFPRAKVHVIVPIPYLIFILGRMRVPAVVVLGLWFASQFFIGQGQQSGGGVAWVAHVGGFIAGAILIFVFGGWARRPRPRPTLY